MKFKTKEELIKEAKIRDSDGRNLGLADLSIDIAFKSFAERVEFYKRYREGALLLDREKPKVFAKLIYDLKSSQMSKEEYLDWLFDHCFKDVIKNVR